MSQKASLLVFAAVWRQCRELTVGLMGVVRTGRGSRDASRRHGIC
jgi:hypothetical protein